ncbi:MAG: hypothetical protein QG597_190 [Actinomycetota bacterium]|nr:hypothetical protein [Actinomycetota bacterium]
MSIPTTPQSTNRSPSGQRRRGHRSACALLATAGILGASLMVAGPASATGDYGPDTCLQGWVWRDAVPNDHVCVIPSVRSLHADYNRRATALHLPGSDQCRPHYTWRLVQPADHVCVDSRTRRQVLADNSQASARRNSLRITVSSERFGPSETCTPEYCTQTSDSGTYYVLTVRNINIGPAIVRLYRKNGTIKQSWSVSVPGAGRNPGGQLTLKTKVPYCPYAMDSYFRVYDSVSTRWSAPRSASTGCSFL